MIKAANALTVKWLDHGREPQARPDPDYPNGIDLDTSAGAAVTCETALPYPARRCGAYVVRCELCGTSALVTTAGRPDDPRSLRIACKPMKGQA